jgi:thiol-disulfide isomerase/thioredoxin
MFKKLAAILVCLFAMCTVTFLLKANAVPPKANIKPSDYDTGITLQKALAQNKKPIVANFYVDWCGYCKRFAPLLQSLSIDYKDKYIFVLVNAEDPKNQKYVKDYYISSFPSLYLINPSNNNRVFVPQGIYSDKELLKKEFDRFLSVNKVK